MHKHSNKKAQTEFGRLLDIMDDLRTGCPWDREQTLESLRKLTIEETYELGDAILQKDMQEIKGELGDLLLHIVFYAKIASETGDFEIYDVVNSICEKLVYRHPHIYGDVKVTGTQDVKENWEDLKLKEGRKGVLAGVPKSLPALIKANRIQEKAQGIGFDWKKKEDVWDKVKEEMAELETEMKANANNKPPETIEEEFGDLLFSIINAARLYGVEPENALEKTNLKFIHRFNYIEEKANKMGKSLRDMDLDEMDVYWEKAKLLDPGK